MRLAYLEKIDPARKMSRFYAICVTSTYEVARGAGYSDVFCPPVLFLAAGTNEYMDCFGDTSPNGQISETLPGFIPSVFD